VFDCFADVKRTRLVVLQAVEQDAILAPGNLCNKLLHNFAIRPRLGERAHVFEIAGRVTRKFWKLPLEVAGKTVDDLRAPAFAFLTGQDVATDVPVMQYQLSVGCKRGLNLGGADTLLDALDKAVVKLCNSLVHNWRGLRFSPGAHRAL